MSNFSNAFISKSPIEKRKPKYTITTDNDYGIGAGASKSRENDLGLEAKTKTTYSARPGGGDKQYFLVSKKWKGKKGKEKLNTNTTKISEKRYKRVTKRWSDKSKNKP